MQTLTGRVLASAILCLFGILAVISAAHADESWSPEKELAEVQQMIVDNGWDWEATLNPVSLLAPEERARMRGYTPPTAAQLRKQTTAVLEPLTRDELPVTWDWRPYLPTPRQQGGCGSCWAFAAAGAAEAVWSIDKGYTEIMSTQQALSCNEYGDDCSGGNMTTVYDLWTWSGSVRDACMPYAYPWNAPCTHNECDFLLKVLNTTMVLYSEEALKTAVMIHPIAVTAHASSAWDYYGGGCLNGPTGAINRKPGEGEFRSNLAVGGYAEAADFTC